MSLLTQLRPSPSPAQPPSPGPLEATTRVRPPVEAGPLLKLTNVSRRYVSGRRDTTALDDVSLQVREGEFVCVVGPSGCGKSTLLNLIAGLDQPTAGEVLFQGKPVRGPGADRVVVFQEAALYPWLNVRANVEFGLKMRRVAGKERNRIVDKYLELVNLRSFEHAFVHELSGGMKQRVQLARALAVEPKMLLMDEPFAALDAQTRDLLQDELQQLWMRTGATILFITHNVREAALLADRVLVMTPGPGKIKALNRGAVAAAAQPRHARRGRLRRGGARRPAARGLRRQGWDQLCHMTP